LGWLLGRRPRQCSKHFTCMFNWPYVIECCQMHQRLYLQIFNLGPLPFLLNKLLTNPRVSPRYADSWWFYWSTICFILSEIEQP
ncbi:hypothetical protein BCV72DRAFT_204565, partial [Rhizopus microsporus var. microsporus]